MKILFATDGAKQSDAAAEMLRHFALSDGDEIKIVSVVDMAVPMAIDSCGQDGEARSCASASAIFDL